MNEESISRFAKRLASIASRAKRLPDTLPQDLAGYALLTRREFSFGFDEATKNDFEEIISELLKNHKWIEKFSEGYLNNELLEIVAQLIKENGQDAHFRKLVSNYEAFDTEHSVYIPLGGFALNLDALTIGKVTFRKIVRHVAQEPFVRIDPFIKTNWQAQHAQIKNLFFGNSPFSEVVCAEFRAVAEPKRAEERAVDECNRVLELLRFASSFLYGDYQRIQIGYRWNIVEVHGAILTVDVLKPYYHCSSQKTGPGSLFVIDEKNVRALDSIGIFRVGKILEKPIVETTEFEKVILRGIHWYGASIDETEMENKFLNLLICIESLLSPKEREPISTAISEGIAFVLGDNFQDRVLLKKRMKHLYGIRSGLSHGGSKEILDADLNHLQDISKKLLVWSIKQVDQFKSHKELFAWLEEQKLT